MPGFHIHPFPAQPFDVWVIFAICGFGRVYWTTFDGPKPDDAKMLAMFADENERWFAVPGTPAEM